MRRHLARWAFAVLLTLQVATWVVGVPAVQSSEMAKLISIWKRSSNYNPAAMSSPYPIMNAYMAFPLVPGVVVAYEECTWSNLGGWDAWTLNLWWGSGNRQLYTWVVGVA